MLNNILEIKLILLNLYSKCNYKTNILKVLKLIKNGKNFLNSIYYLINNLYYYNKKKISINLYLKICSLISLNNKEKYGKFFDSNFFILKNLSLNYTKLEINFISKCLDIKKIKLNLKVIKKINTRMLIKCENEIYETLKNRLIIIFLYIVINNADRINIILKLINNFYNFNFFFYFNLIKKLCTIIDEKNKTIYNKLYLGLLPSNNILYYFNYLINYLIINNNLKVELSIDIYHLDILKLINIILNNKIKIIKIKLIIGIPDLFFEYLIKKKKWFLFDPLDVKNEYCYYIQNFYDEYIGYGNFRNFYNKIIKNNKIFKVSLNTNFFLKKILKIKFLIINYTDTINRNFINKQINNIFPNFYCTKIFDENNYFKKKNFFYNKNDIEINKNNENEIDVFTIIKFNFCKYKNKKIVFNYNFLNFKNNKITKLSEKNFFLSYRTKNLIIFFYSNFYLKKSIEYLYYYIINANCYISSFNNSYFWYYNNDIQKYSFFEKNKYTNIYWEHILNKINKYELNNSFYIKVCKKKIISLENIVIKKILISWQKQYEILEF